MDNSPECPFNKKCNEQHERHLRVHMNFLIDLIGRAAEAEVLG